MRIVRQLFVRIFLAVSPSLARRPATSLRRLSLAASASLSICPRAGGLLRLPARSAPYD